MERARDEDGTTDGYVYPHRCECVGECGGHETRRCHRRHGQRLRIRYNLKGEEVGSYIVLTVAHLDHTPENCDDENLRAMCQRCHLAYDAPRKRAERIKAQAAGTEPLFGEEIT